MAEAEAIAFPEAPKKANYPKWLAEHELFTKMLQVMEGCPSKTKDLSAFIRRTLHPDVPENKMPAIPTSPKELMRFIKQYCNPFNMDLLKKLAKFLNDDELTSQAKECKRTLSDQLQQAKWDTEVDVAPPPAYTVMLAKMKQREDVNTTVREAAEVQDFVAKHLMLKGHHGILCLTGLANDTLVFYTLEGKKSALLQRMQYEKEKLSAQGVEEIIFVKFARLDVASGVVTLHRDVPTQNPAAECPEFGVLLIGETGSGKSTLINNLLRVNIEAETFKGAPEGATPNSETGEITEYRGTAAGVPVILYDTPGTDGSSAESDRELCKEIKKLIKAKKVCLTIFCFTLNGQRLKRSHIATMRTYHEATVNWDSTIVALTFADMIKAPRAERNSVGFNKAEYFERKIREWEKDLRDTLVQNVGVPRSAAKHLIMRPTTDEWDSPLPDHKNWFVPLWLDILELLEPAPYFRFLEIHRDSFALVPDASTEAGSKVKFHLTGEDLVRFEMIAQNKAKAYSGSAIAATAGAVTVAVGATVAIVSASTLVGIATCGVGAFIFMGGLISFGVVGLIAVVYNDSKARKQENE